MATWQYQLASPPTEPRTLELWLQHAAGRIFFEDMRDYALQRIDPQLAPNARVAVEKGIDDAVYGLMMILDGVTGALSNATHRVELGVTVRLVEAQAPGKVVAELDLAQGDGMCMGYHGWREGNFGDDPITREQPTE